MTQKPGGVALSLNRNHVAPGGRISFSASLGRLAANTVFRLTVLDPEGNSAPHYAANIEAPQGTAEGSFQLAMNDNPGKWTLRVRDCLTGESAESAFTVTSGTQ